MTAYAAEVLLKMLGLGVIRYFTSGWNVFDFCVTGTAFFGLVTETIGVPFSFIFILRSLRILKLFELKKRYQDIMGTFMFIMVKRFGSVSAAVLILYYFYAIIGMEIFSAYDLTDCCKNSSVEPYFARGDNNSGYYYLNNFSSIVTSFGEFITQIHNDAVSQHDTSHHASVIRPHCPGRDTIIYIFSAS